MFTTLHFRALLHPLIFLLFTHVCKISHPNRLSGTQNILQDICGAGYVPVPFSNATSLARGAGLVPSKPTRSSADRVYRVPIQTLFLLYIAYRCIVMRYYCIVVRYRANLVSVVLLIECEAQ